MKNIPTIISLAALIAISFTAMAIAQQPQSLSPGKLIIDGTGDSQELLRALSRRFEQLHPGTEVDIPDAIGTSAAIRAVHDKKAELARVSRPLRANESHPTIKYVVFAKSPVVFAVHPGVRVSGLSSEQITGIYSGKYINWKQLGGVARKIYPVGRESTDPGRTAIEEHIEGFGGIKKSVNKTYYTASGIVEAAVRHDGTIGYAPMAMVRKTDLKVLKIDGVYPLVVNVQNGKYGMTIPLGIVYRGELGPLAKAFVDFLFSHEAQKIIIKHGCMPVGREG